MTTTEKFLGIWMDDSNAHLMEFTDEGVMVQHFSSEFTYEMKIRVRGRDEDSSLTEGKILKRKYYERIADVIREYREVLLFGPSDAKAELFRSMKSGDDFVRATIVIRHAGSMDEQQRLAYAAEYFSKFSKTISTELRQPASN